LKNIIEKIWHEHVVSSTAGFPDIFYIDRILLHEVTSAQAFAELKQRNIPIRNSNNIIATIDHSIPTTVNRREISDINARAQINKLRQNCHDNHIKIYDIDSGNQGIVHVIGPELGFTLPGSTIICGDSHTSTHGAFGCLAFGVGTSELTHALATNCILQDKPKTYKVEFIGTPHTTFTAKDAILALIAKIGIGGGNGHIIEYCGDYIKKLSMEERMTVCNMSIECGARAGLIAPDEKTFAYLKHRQFAPSDFDNKVKQWQQLNSDKNAHYDQYITVDITDLTPMITWGINPEHAITLSEPTPKISDCNDHVTAEKAYAYTKLTPQQSMLGVPIDYAFVGSCTNGRIEDLRKVAAVLKNKKIASSVTMYIVPGSEQVMRQAQAEGLEKIFREANCEFRMPGCSMCLSMNNDRVPAGKRCISTTNRNFIGRQGTGSITHLASPETVAISAVRGYITSLAHDIKE